MLNKYVVLFTYLLQGQFFTLFISRERKKIYAFCEKYSLKLKKIREWSKTARFKNLRKKTQTQHVFEIFFITSQY